MGHLVPKIKKNPINKISPIELSKDRRILEQHNDKPDYFDLNSTVLLLVERNLLFGYCGIVFTNVSDHLLPLR